MQFSKFLLSYRIDINHHHQYIDDTYIKHIYGRDSIIEITHPEFSANKNY